MVAVEGLAYAPTPGAVLLSAPDHSSLPAVFLPDTMSVCQSLCKPVLPILYSVYFIIIFVIGGATQSGAPNFS